MKKDTRALRDDSPSSGRNHLLCFQGSKPAPSFFSVECYSLSYPQVCGHLGLGSIGISVLWSSLLGCVFFFLGCWVETSNDESSGSIVWAGWFTGHHPRAALDGCQTQRCACLCDSLHGSDHEHNRGQLAGGCYALRACGLPWSPIISWVGGARSSLWLWACVTRLGPAVWAPCLVLSDLNLLLLANQQ